MSNNTIHNNAPSEYHLCISLNTVLEAPGTTSPVPRGLQRSHWNPADNPTAVLHPRRLLRHKVGGKRGFQRSPQFPLSTPKYVLCHHSGWEIVFGDLLESFCSGRIFTHMQRGRSHHARSTPHHSAQTTGSWAEKEVLDNACQKVSCTTFFFLNARHLQLREPQISHFLFSYQATGKLTLSIHWLPTRTHSLSPPPVFSVQFIPSSLLKIWKSRGTKHAENTFRNKFTWIKAKRPQAFTTKSPWAEFNS